jgi:hypothetical protein
MNVKLIYWANSVYPTPIAGGTISLPSHISRFSHAAKTKRYRGSMQFDMRLSAPSDEPCQRVERHLRIAMQRKLVHLVE